MSEDVILAAEKVQPKFVELENGVKVLEIREGTGPSPVVGDKVSHQEKKNCFL
jgi:hypothetical protein